MSPVATPPPWSLPTSTDVPPAHADVVIVGAGLPGMFAAMRLAEAGATVCVLEARDVVGAGTSGRHLGLAHTGLVEHAVRLARSIGDRDAAAIYAFSQASLALLDAVHPLDRTGMVWAATEALREPTEMADSAAWCRAQGIAVDLWAADDVTERLGSHHLGPALFAPDEGLVDVPATLAALLRRVQDAGGRVVTNATVQSVSPEADRLRATTTRGIVDAEAVVYAGSHGLRPLASLFTDTLTPVREQALRIEGPQTPYPLRAGFGWTRARPVPGAMLWAGCRWASPHLEQGERDDRVVTPAIQERLEASARRFLPTSGAITHRWSWIADHSCDGLPLVGPFPGDPRRVVLAGFGGLEIGLGVRAAQAVVDGLLTGKADGVPARFDCSRFL